jgi:uncharacterized membrane protein required for colicin V production
MEALNPIDLICLLVCLILAALGAWAGFVKSLFRLTALVVAVFGVFLFANPIAGVLMNNVQNLPPFAALLVAAMLLFLGIWLGIRWIGNRAHNLIKKTSLNGLNRILGAFLGLFKATVFSFLFLALLNLIPAQGNLAQIRSESLFFKLYLEFEPDSFKMSDPFKNPVPGTLFIGSPELLSSSSGTVVETTK